MTYKYYENLKKKQQNEIILSVRKKIVILKKESLFDITDTQSTHTHALKKNWKKSTNDNENELNVDTIVVNIVI